MVRDLAADVKPGFGSSVPQCASLSGAELNDPQDFSAVLRFIVIIQKYQTQKEASLEI